MLSFCFLCGRHAGELRLFPVHPHPGVVGRCRLEKSGLGGRGSDLCHYVLEGWPWLQVKRAAAAGAAEAGMERGQAEGEQLSDCGYESFLSVRGQAATSAGKEHFVSEWGSAPPGEVTRTWVPGLGWRSEHR